MMMGGQVGRDLGVTVGVYFDEQWKDTRELVVWNAVIAVLCTP